LAWYRQLPARRPVGRDDSAMREATMNRLGPVAIHQGATPSLGDRSYLVEDGSVAVVIDPQRDIDRLLALAAKLGVAITHVVETHIHNDYVSGGRALAAATGAAYVVNAEDPVHFERLGVSSGDLIEASDSIQLSVLATPGHTDTHLAYLLEIEGRAVAAFTGGSLLYGSTGRPDLLGAAMTGPLVHAQWRSARRLATEAADATLVMPTHGFGSFCAAQPAEQVVESTIGREKQANPVLRLGENDYVEATLAGLDAYPAYYDQMRPANLAGAGPWDQTPPPAAAGCDLAVELLAGTHLIDVRTRREFSAGYLAGSWNLGLDGPIASYLGWLLPKAAGSTLVGARLGASRVSTATEVALLGADPEQVELAQRELARIGFARPVAHAVGDPSSWVSAESGDSLRVLPQATFADLASVSRHRRVLVVDVRRRSEWTAGHLDIATNIPLHELPSRLGEITGVGDTEIWVHCAAGYRASTAASILANAGCRVVAIDDNFGCAADAGLVVESSAGAAHRLSVGVPGRRGTGRGTGRRAGRVAAGGPRPCFNR
jgi:hydroxyacylglutathione hydrolase